MQDNEFDADEIDISEMPKEIAEQNLHRHAKLLLLYALDALEERPKQISKRRLSGMIRKHLGMKPAFIK